MILCSSQLRQGILSSSELYGFRGRLSRAHDLGNEDAFPGWVGLAGMNLINTGAHHLQGIPLYP